MGDTIKDILSQLKSEKIVERKKGLEKLQHYFAQNQNVLDIDHRGDGKAWLSIFQALCSVVRKEREAYVRKDTPTVRGRLGEAGAAVRWLTERSVERMNNKVVQSLMSHLLQTMVYQQKLVTPLALDYVKAIRCIISWTPHLEHLEDDRWAELVEMGFNAILGDSLKKKFIRPSDDVDIAEASGSGTDRDDTELLDTDEDEQDTGIPSTSTVSAGKRHRQPIQAARRHVRRRNSPVVSLEQIEFVSILSILFQSPSAPLLSPRYPDLSNAVLSRFERYLHYYPGEASLHHDYLIALSASLSHFALNRYELVRHFAVESWDDLVAMWGYKNYRIKENLVVVLRRLLPFLTAEQYTDVGKGLSYGEGVSRLYLLLSGEAESRWGINGLSLESLRLEILEPDQDVDANGAFVANTFRHGWHFDAAQALSWAILELQADCAEKLYVLSESVNPTTLSTSKSQGKLFRSLTNPITLLLSSIKTSVVTSQIRSYHLQFLLFFIDRHWRILHDGLQQEIISTLQQFISSEDGSIQSWVFLCLAAIVHANNALNPALPSPASSQSHCTAIWDPIWTHATRRSNVPSVCRAACHTAYLLLRHSKRLLTVQRVLVEIETLAKDLDVQGPAFPYDSVCHFLILCLRVANQDVRLYRMQLEEKVLTWLMDSWRMGNVSRLKMPLHTTGDVLSLLESICGSSRRGDLTCRMMLPDCPIVDAVIEEHRTAVIRDFVLRAYLPPFRTSLSPLSQSNTRPSTLVDQPSIGIDTRDLAQPRGRERRISGFLLKSMEELAAGWESDNKVQGYTTAEKARSSLDLAVVAVAFEASLVINGTQSNRRVIQAACRLAGLIFPLVLDRRWTPEERALILYGLQPLITTDDIDDGAGWEIMLCPDEKSGIRKQTLKVLNAAWSSKNSPSLAKSRRDLQRLVFQSADIQDAFAGFMDAFRNALRLVLGRPLSSNSHPDVVDVDYSDGFGPVRTVQDVGRPLQNAKNMAVKRYIVDLCVTSLAVVPVLQSASGEPTRDKELADLVLDCDGEEFLLIAPAYLDNVRRRAFNFSVTNLGRFLDKLEEILPCYDYSHSEAMQMLVIRFLDSTMDLWLQPSVAEDAVGNKVLDLCQWLSQMLSQKKIRSWRIGDYLIRFLDNYLARDPSEAIWSLSIIEDEDEDEDKNKDEEKDGDGDGDGNDNGDGIDDEDRIDNEDRIEDDNQDADIDVFLPTKILPSLCADEDIRVRFRAAVVNARLFTLARVIRVEPLKQYKKIQKFFERGLNEYEKILTRLLCLGNLIVVSSAVRRGPYWHLLETCLHTSDYDHHIQAILSGVRDRMGLSSASELFEPYASQIAYSIRQSERDFLRFPPGLLGYRDRKECAEATFHAFTPTNILAGGQKKKVDHGRILFANHCRAVQKSQAEGFRDCFPDIVGYQIVAWIDTHVKERGGGQDALVALLRRIAADFGCGDEFDEYLPQNVDGIVVAILRTLGDQDFSPEGPIVRGIRQSADVENVDHAIQTFQHLTFYRLMDKFETHQPNLPCYTTITILRALGWLNTCVPQANSRSITYHVLHQLFADLERSPMVNEQLRLLNAIALWVASHSDHFMEHTLLRTLMNRATAMLMHVDLSRSAQSILQWCFSICSRRDEDIRLPDILIRISCIAHEFSHDGQDPSIAQLGRGLLDWIEIQALELCKNKMLKPSVVKAVSAWPREPSPALGDLCKNVHTSELSIMLKDEHISASKFRLVRRIRDLAASEGSVDMQFMASNFWRLKDCIPPVDQLTDDDIDAFSTLLVIHHGLMGSVGNEQISSETVRTRHRSGYNDQNASGTQKGAVAHRAIITSLLAMLDAVPASQVHVVYLTLRSLMSVYHQELYDICFFPAEALTELQYLQAYSKLCADRSHHDLYETFSSEIALESSREFGHWITQTTTALCDSLMVQDPFYTPLPSILQSDRGFAEQLFPVLVHSALQADRDSRCREVLSNYFTAILEYDYADVFCQRAIVDVVLHLRHLRPIETRDALAHDKWLDIDFTLLSRSAIRCNAYTTALLFLELGAEYSQGSSSEISTSEHILFDIYSHIDEPDGFYGIKTQDLHRFLIRRLHHEKQWDKAFQFHGAALEADATDATDVEGIVQALHSFGFNQLALNTLENMSTGMGGTTSSSAIVYQLGWRAETWDLPEDMGERNSSATLYTALRAIYRERNQVVVDDIIRNAAVQDMMQLHNLGDENLAEIRQIVQNLMCLSQVRLWRCVPTRDALLSKRGGVDEYTNFTQIDADFDFSDIEAIMATRVSLVRSVRQKEQRGQIGDLVSPFCRELIDLEKDCLIRLAEAAREANQSQVALNSIVRAQKLEQTPSWTVSQEFANVLWLIKEPKLAVQSLSTLLSSVQLDMPADEIAGRTNIALLLARLGTWSGEASLSKPSLIISQYFDPAKCLLLEANPDMLAGSYPECATVFHQYAIFAERQYHSIAKSPDALRFKVYVDRKTDEMKRRKEQINKSQENSKEWEELQRAQRRAEKLLKQDRDQFKVHIGARNSYLSSAIEMYARCLEASDSFDDDSTIRLCSLWLANFDNTDPNLDFDAALDRVPSRKFTFLAHQLTARLSKPDSAPLLGSQQTLQMLISRMCREHPFHSLFQVYCLKVERPTQTSSVVTRRQSGRHESLSTQAERAAAAADIFDGLRGDAFSGGRVRDVEAVCDASLQWAKHPIKDEVKNGKKSKMLRVPDQLLIRTLCNLNVPVITAHTPLDPTMQYRDCVCIVKYDTRYSTAGGINLPKIIDCFGSDGKRYKQLFKGEGDDDLRQDAVMEQVFDLVNVVLRHDRETRKRMLSVRGYKVIPLAAQAGVLEFVVNTMPLNDWLSQAHLKYRPKDISDKEFRSQMTRKRDECKHKPDPLAALYLQLRQRFRPVMRHYFTEMYKDPTSWFRMRLKYARSVATTSIVGHVLGLGDRHTSNILMDNSTGEVVHIDLGIAFEQGKLLPIPERVPFRLTEDMVDGLGISGTQGVFQRCAEETLRVLREGSEVILTVLEVFKYDPLHSWTASEYKVKRMQNHSNETAQLTGEAFRYAIGIDLSSGPAGEAADRALSSVSRKLDKTLSVEYTVNELIAEATDPTNLANMFIGWAPQF